MAFVVTVFPTPDSDGDVLLPGEAQSLEHINELISSKGSKGSEESGVGNGLGKDSSDMDPNRNRSSSCNEKMNSEHIVGKDNPSYNASEEECSGVVIDTTVSKTYSTPGCLQNGTGHHHSSVMEVNHNEISAAEEKKMKEIEKEGEAATKEDGVLDMFFKLLVCLLCGIVMGLALEKGRVFEPRSIRCQFTYQLWIMMKMFLSAGATGLLCLATLSLLPFTKKAFADARVEYLSCLTTRGTVMATVGGMLLGAGMALAGACPGMVLAQVGAWVGNGSGLVTFCGCLVGAFTYGFCHPLISRFLGRSSPYQKQLADDWMSHIPFAGLAYVLAAIMAGVVIAIEFWRPWRTEILPSPAENFKPTWFMTEYAWPPYVAGILIGLLQLPLVLVIRDTIGGSGSYCTISSQVLVTRKMEEAMPYLAKFKRGMASWWQVFFVAGVILGGMMSSLLSHTIAKTAGVGWGTSFFGGFVMLFGARFAGGCTSGHGLSGVGVLALLSFVAVGAMFAGGTIVGVIGWGMEKGDVIDSYCPLSYD